MPAVIRTLGDALDAHQVELLRYLRGLTRDATEADDLFQDTCLKALPAFGRLKPDSNHRAWLFRIATNVFLNHRRATTRRREVVVPADTVSAPPVRAGGDGRVAQACRRAILELPPRQRAAFVQRRLLGHSYPEIADTMGGTPAAIRANVYQAVRRLKRVLASTVDAMEV